MNDSSKHSRTEPEVGIDPSLDRFEGRLRAQLPHLPAAGMQRVEEAFRVELNEAYPPAPLPLRSWSHWVAMAAMLILTIGLAWHVSHAPSRSPSNESVAARVSDQFEVVIEADNAGLSGGGSQSAWDSLLQSIDRYASLIGLDRLTRR